MRTLILLLMSAIFIVGIVGFGDSGPGGDTSAAAKDVAASGSKGGPEMDPNDPRMPRGGGAPGKK